MYKNLTPASRKDTKRLLFGANEASKFLCSYYGATKELSADTISRAVDSGELPLVNSKNRKTRGTRIFTDSDLLAWSRRHLGIDDWWAA